MTKLEQLQAAAKDALDRVTAIASGAEAASREMTADEKTQVADLLAKGRDLVQQIKTAKADEGVLAEAKSLAEQIGDGAKADLDVLGQSGGDVRRRVKNLGLTVIESPQFKAALATALGGKSHVGEKTRFESGPISVKSLFTGTSDTSAGAFVTPEQTGILETLGRAPLTVRSLISVRRTTSDRVEFVRQVSHTNNAAPVPEAQSALPIAATATATTTTAVLGGLKPEGAWAYERDGANVVTIAEWVPATKRALADVAALQGQIDDELRRDLAEAEERQVLSGDGTGENFTGILNTDGTQGQAWDTDLFTTTRRAVTKARRVGRVNPTAWLFSPEDEETIDLARENGGSGAFLNGGPFSNGVNTLWGIPRISSENVPAGTFILGDWTKAILWDREEATVTITDSHADFFVRNLVAILAEQRAAFAVTRPSAFVIGDAAAA